MSAISTDSSVEEFVSSPKNTNGLGNILATPSFALRSKKTPKRVEFEDIETDPSKIQLTKKKRIRKQIGFGRKRKRSTKKKSTKHKKSTQIGSGVKKSRNSKKKRLRRLYSFRRSPF